MNYLSNLGFGGKQSLPEDLYTNNVEEICKFSQASDEAQIKAQNGKLGQVQVRAISGAAGLIKGYTGVDLAKTGWVGTQLEGTVEVIDRTAQEAIKKGKEQLETVEKAQKRFQYEIQDIRKLQDEINTELKLMDGINRIKSVYEKRYTNEPNHQGLKELQTLCADYGKELRDNMKKYGELIDNVKRNSEKTPNLLTQTILLPEGGKIYDRDEAAKSLTPYCQVFSPNVTTLEASERFAKGEKLLEEIMGGERTLPPTDTAEAQEELCNITWALMKQAIDDQQGFYEGTFVLEDPQNFLFNYLKKNPGYYLRPSTHFEGRSDNNHGGVDVLNGKMPAEKRTLLFGIIDNPPIPNIPKKLLFIKPENYSADPRVPLDYVLHGSELLKSKYNKFSNPKFDEGPGMRKERVPSDIKREFDKIVDCLKGGLRNAPSLFSDLKLDKSSLKLFDFDVAKLNGGLWGVAYMSRFVDAVKSAEKKNIPVPAELDLSMFTTEAGKIKNPQLCTGREVYLGNRFAKNIIPYHGENLVSTNVDMEKFKTTVNKFTTKGDWVRFQGQFHPDKYADRSNKLRDEFGIRSKKDATEILRLVDAMRRRRGFA